MNSAPTFIAYIDIKRSTNVTIENITASNFQKLLFKIDKSTVESILNLHISESLQTIDFTESKIKMISQCNFINDGAENKSTGGAISLFNSEVIIKNSTFTGNKAIKGGAISFECTSKDI